MTGPYATEAPFAFDFGVKSVTTVEDGDLILEGWAATYGDPETTDLQNEYFEPGAWTQAVVDEFLAGQASCLANHDADRPLGTITHAELRAGGLWVKALVPKPSPGSWADREDWYEKLKRNVIRGMSVAGRFWRRPGLDGIDRIYKSTISEISISPYPINPAAIGTVSLATAAQKAFASPGREEDLHAIKSTITNLRSEAMRWNRKTEPEPRVTMLYSTSDPGGDYRRAQAQQRARDFESARQGRIQDGPNGAAEEAAFHKMWGVEPAKRQRKDNERKERVYELSSDQLAALHGQAGVPVEPTMAGSFLEQKLKEARAGEIRRKLIAPLDDLIARKEGAAR